MSSSSGSSSGSRSSPAPTRKKRQIETELSDDSDPPSTEEVTVLSHAERRRQKKKLKQQTTTASVSLRKKRKLEDGTGAPSVNPKAKTTTATAKARAKDDSRQQKRQNSIWVGNLSFRTTQDALREFFDGIGTITRIHMPMRRGIEGENIGFAYVDFETSEAKATAITLSEGQLDGRNLLIKDGDDFTGRPNKAKTEPSEGARTGGGEVDKNPTTVEGKSLSKTAQKILRAQKQPPASTLFLGNLGFETTEESIRGLFETHRHWGHKGRGSGMSHEEDEVDAEKSKDVWIRKIRMGTFEDSGNCKGFAFVDFTSIEHATAALVNPRNHRLNGRDLVVEYASPDAVRRGGGGPRHQKGDKVLKNVSGNGNALRKGSATAAYPKQRPPHLTGQAHDAEIVDEPMEVTTPRTQRPGCAGHNGSHSRRAKPGAALAHAQRQSAAILPSQGRKVIF